MFSPEHDSPVYVIAEIGQNHQGNIKIAKELITCAKSCGVDCVKFQKSSLPDKFNTLALNRPYASPHAWGDTYGEHKKYLEFSEEEYKDLQKFAEDLEIDFTASAMDIRSLEFLHKMGVPFIKIGSGDACNYQLIRAASNLKVDILLSTGMCDMEDVNKAVKILSIGNCRFAIMHCVSSYPVPENELNLKVIKTYKQEFQSIPIGYSGHELGVDSTLVAVQLGVKIVERHFTLNKDWKGSDHACSLLPSEMAYMVNAIRQFENNPVPVDAIKWHIALGSGVKEVQKSEKACIEKLGKTLVAARQLSKGVVLTEQDVAVKVAEPKGIHCRHLDEIMGRTVLCDISDDHSIHWDNLAPLSNF